MAGKKKRNSKDSGKGNNAGGGDGSEQARRGSKSGGGKSKKGSSKNKGGKFQGDIFNEAAMENAYYCCHNVQDVLKTRGFPWPDAQKKKKKGKK